MSSDAHGNNDDVTEAMQEPASTETSPGPPASAGVDEALMTEGVRPQFKPGDALRHDQAAALCAERATTVVVLAGGYRSGKTTLLTAVYEHFNQEPVADWRFAGSTTLFGFERRCYGGRRESGLEYPRTQRSARLQPPWLHLDLVQPNGVMSQARRLLLADVSGEWFDELVTGEIAVGDLPHLWRADHLAIILDGRRLAIPAEVHAERARAETLTRILVEQDAVVSLDALSLVVTKLDEMLSRDRDAVNKLGDIARGIARAAALDRAIPVWRTAAQPKTSVLPAGHGVVGLFTSWLEVPSRTRRHPLSTPPLPQTWFARFRGAP